MQCIGEQEHSLYYLGKIVALTAYYRFNKMV